MEGGKVIDEKDVMSDLVKVSHLLLKNNYFEMKL